MTHEIPCEKNKMNWIESIVLRSFRFKRETLRELKRTIVENEQDEGLKAFEIYSNASVETDTAIHIHWKTKEDRIKKRSVGLRIALALKEFGQVNHTIWIKD
jgi:hypothetical protein